LRCFIRASISSVARRFAQNLYASMPPTELIEFARASAKNHALDSALVCAVIEQESAWDPHAIRYEPAFRMRYVAPLGLSQTEEVARSISWGLMQLMGQVARERGFTGNFLSALCDPATGLDIGCAVLASKLSAAGGEVAQALALWNGGASATYAPDVLARIAKYR
jgi:soluble lytic murein transglycosylase-like protein